MLEFENLGYRKRLNDLQRTRLEVVARVVQNHGKVLRNHATEAAQRDTPSWVNIPLSSLFSECTIFLRGEKNLTTYANSAHKSFIDTKFSHCNDAKNMACLSMVLL